MSEHHRKRVSLYDANKLYFFFGKKKFIFHKDIHSFNIHSSLPEKKEYVRMKEKKPSFMEIYQIYITFSYEIFLSILLYVHVKYSSIINFKYIYVMCMLRLFLPFSFIIISWYSLRFTFHE
jgi:hypothetical protein